MMWREATKPLSNLFFHYWKTGITSRLPSDIRKANHLNPTWVYSREGEVFYPFNCTFPMFHFAPAFAPLASDPAKSGPSDTKSSPMDVAKRQFRAWCDAFRVSRAAGSIIIRFFTGYELTFCRALDLYNTTGNTNSGLYAAEWGASRLHLDELEHKTSPAPTKFHAIDTSNLTNHLGLLNLIVATRPLMEDSPMFRSILYTEETTTLDQHEVRPFLKRLCTTIPTLAALLGIAPLAYVSNFTTHPNVHENITEVSHTIERIAWVDPACGDCFGYLNGSNVSFGADDLVNLLFEAYKESLFLGEDIITTLMSEISLFRSKVKQSYYYDQSSMAAFFQLVQRRVHLNNGTWDSVIKGFLDIVQHSPTRPLEKAQYHNLLVQLHLHGVHTADSLKPHWDTLFRSTPRSDVFKDWSSVPSLLCVVLTVPRQTFHRTLLQEKRPRTIFRFQCNLRADSPTGSSFPSIRCAWGKCVPISGSDKVALQEDPHGVNGKSDLIVWFWAPSYVLAYKTKTVGFALVPTSDAFVLHGKNLGASLEIFTTNLEDKQRVRLLTYSPTAPSGAPIPSQAITMRYPNPTPERLVPMFLAGVAVNEGRQGVVSFSARVEIDPPIEQQALLNGAKIKTIQISPCSMRLYVDDYTHVISYPYPILGTLNKLRIARRSHYIEVVVSIAEPLGSGGYALDRAPVLHRAGYTPWNIHHINLDRMPLLNTTDVFKKLPWISCLTALQLSDHERGMMAGERETEGPQSVLMAAVKDTIHSIVAMHALPDEKQRVFGFCESGEQAEVYAVLLVAGIRLDLASCSIVIDGAILPLSHSIPTSLKIAIDKMVNSNPLSRLPSIGDESIAVKKLLPAFVERARTWKHTTNCEYTATADIPLSVEFGHSPICSCGQGIGFDAPEWQSTLWKALLPFATRIAISPLFSVPYIDTISQSIDDLLRPRDGRRVDPPMANRMRLLNVCWVCGKTGNLSACAKCKSARYCSISCQRKNWEAHKKHCRSEM
ncbi:hypothetical protein FS749_016025 [Ceratobasidium sp. UAMH 11750]|nr:hypothetical protein FS749_016025 [Ceratobasidium sp. UAMH 11750]